jgi:carboxyl-terminal processing protease
VLSWGLAMRLVLAACLLAVLAAATSAAPKASALATKDVEFALKALKKECGHFFAVKGIDWQDVSRRFRKEVRQVRSREDHWVILARLLARVRDGHAHVKVEDKAGKLAWPLRSDKPQGGPGMFWCRSGKRILVKNAWSAAASAGVSAGMEVLKVDGEPVGKWLDAVVEERRDVMGFSTDHQAFFAACHWGLTGDRGTPMRLALRTVDGKSKKVTITRGRASGVPSGPVFPPEGLQRIGRQSYGKTAGGWGYIHLRDVKGALPGQLDTMLAALGNVPGLVLDCRANGGGGCDHDAVLGRFVPAGKTLQRSKAYPIKSAGPNPYGGPMVVIVDAGVRSAGETVSGMFKEDGRAYMIGESPTAGMSSSKKTIALPSGLFSLYVSVRSNKARFNGGRGIEGIGVIPHEIVEYQARDLAKKVDTLIARAEALLADFPRGKVPYQPKRLGWKAPR